MEKRKIGRSGMETSAMGLGTWAIGGGTWWGDNDDDASIETIRYAVEKGVTWIDTAPVYGFGHSETVVGKAVKDFRNEVILSTKGGLQWENSKGYFHFSRDGREVYRDLSRDGLYRDVELSLKRLDTDYIDIYYTHWQSPDPENPSIEETMTALMAMKAEGLIRGIGASNVDLAQVKEYCRHGQLDVIQQKYSILDREVEEAVMPYCLENGIMVQTYSSLEQGLLTGRIGLDYVVKENEVREGRKWWQDHSRAIALEMLEGWKDLAEKYSTTLGNLVMAWTMAQSEGMNMLCGARKKWQMEENVLAGDLAIEPEDLARMRRDSDEAIRREKAI